MKKADVINFLSKYFLCFMIYSLIGWLYEEVLEVFIYRWGFSNRGILFGPYLPIYGVGALVFILCFHKVMRKKDSKAFSIAKPFLIFFGCMVVAMTIELVTSYVLEFFSGSWPWQTYKDYPFNFQARIALNPGIRFGLGGLLFCMGFSRYWIRGLRNVL